MKKQIISASMLVVGFLIGATALSAVAAWSGPSVKDVGETDCNPPHCNVKAPINVGDTFQYKTGKLGLGSFISYSNEINRPLLDVNGTGIFTNLGVTGNLAVSKGASTTAGTILVNNGGGIAGWESVSAPYTGDSCKLLVSTQTGSTWKGVDVPTNCINKSCELMLATYNSSNQVDNLRSVIIDQFASTARTKKPDDINYWWSKSGGTADGTDCNVGRNGTTAGCNGIVASSRGSIILRDDNEDGVLTHTEIRNDRWIMEDSNSNYYAEVYVCD